MKRLLHVTVAPLAYQISETANGFELSMARSSQGAAPGAMTLGAALDGRAFRVHTDYNAGIYTSSFDPNLPLSMTYPP